MKTTKKVRKPATKKPAKKATATTPIKTLTISRKKWLRGKLAWEKQEDYDSNQSALFSKEKGKFCCLGFASLECGYAKKEITDLPSPSEIDNKAKVLAGFPWLIKKREDVSYAEIYTNSEACEKAMDINDRLDITEKEREKELKELFKANGVTVKFVP